MSFVQFTIVEKTKQKKEERKASTKHKIDLYPTRSGISNAAFLPFFCAYQIRMLPSGRRCAFLGNNQEDLPDWLLVGSTREPREFWRFLGVGKKDDKVLFLSDRLAYKGGRQQQEEIDSGTSGIFPRHTAWPMFDLLDGKHRMIQAQ